MTGGENTVNYQLKSRGIRIGIRKGNCSEKDGLNVPVKIQSDKHGLNVPVKTQNEKDGISVWHPCSREGTK